jgi:hypothetical protein
MIQFGATTKELIKEETLMSKTIQFLISTTTTTPSLQNQLISMMVGKS